MDDDEKKLQGVNSSFFYLSRLPIYETEKPFYVNFPVTEKSGSSHSNLSHDLYENILIRDIRGHEDKFGIDTHGFQLIRHATSMSNVDFENDASIRSKYYPEMEQLVIRLLGASKVFVFEHTPRLHVPYRKGCGCDRKRQPLVSAHIDQTYASSVQRVKHHMGSDADSLLNHRFQVVNLWRPLFGPLRDFPLTVGDARSFDLDRDGEATDLVFPHYVGESLNLYHHPGHQWYYVSDQSRDEVWMFKCFDSKQDVAYAAPHCSFDIQKGSYTQRPRESIELRLLVFYDE
ncbi:hypothetical protein F4825DRAFT_445537 [Nemania diffusa]|nr:hypothetical protein F4825DRAFT_445537 [Nemania diffusa]